MQKALFKRIHESVLAKSERKVLIAIAQRLPKSIKPDHLTAFGILGATVVLMGYLASHWNRNFIWIANLGLFMHWLGDSLDGTVARFRGIERPSYGYFLDQTVDVIGNLLIALGVGLSPWCRLDTTLLVLTGYHMLSIYVFVRNVVTREFHVSLFGLGPTEMRLGILVMNIFIFVIGADAHKVFGSTMTWCDVLLIAVFVGLSALFVVEIRKEAKRLLELDSTGRGGN